ncbi:hypothetical protein BW687_001585 [Pseudomonas graminis]|uniref:hypothetical protein n=1 Tax=Pseudomonas graminis TaxID=158627 RepID=UPI002349266D|nr:hypothetical protein [Pseudomonas graminis]MDC6378871.1 hypothetical protein [Pseudomonas graminis]
MDYRLESEVWRGVQGSLTNEGFAALIWDALSTYKRPPGYSPLDRLYAGDVGEAGLEALSIALNESGNPTGAATASYVSLRAPLRAHLYRVLQRHVIAHFLASDKVVDNCMASDLGL